MDGGDFLNEPLVRGAFTSALGARLWLVLNHPILKVKVPALSDLDDSALLGFAREHLLASAETKRRYAESSAGDLVKAARLVAECFAGGGKLMLCGNGGSAADCQHIAAEFTSVLTQKFNRRALPAIALTTDTSFLTARGNDYGFDSVFSRQVEALGKSGDVLMGSSTSGNAKNVLLAIEAARGVGMKTVGLTGSGGGKLLGAVDHCLRVPAVSTAHIQECHIAMGHIIVAIVEKYLFNSDGSDKPFDA
jgi:D-sedoheptulose 7-phosphate isomerase